MVETLKPLFIEKTETLSRLVRLQNLGGGTVGEDILEHAITETATTFWKEFGATQLAAFQAYEKAIPPVTDTNFKRLLCEQLEVDITRYHLAAHLPIAYKDGKADFATTFNTEGAFRILRPDEMAKLRHQWWYDKQRGISIRLAILKGHDTKRVTLAGHDAIDTSKDPVILHGVSYYRPTALLDLTLLGFQHEGN